MSIVAITAAIFAHFVLFQVMLCVAEDDYDAYDDDEDGIGLGGAVLFSASIIVAVAFWVSVLM